jgi:TorA maturation chaperone TorD
MPAIETRSMEIAEQAYRDSLRSECYRLLSACFHPPERDQFIRDGVCLQLSTALNELCPETGAGSHAAAMHEHLGGVDDVSLRVDHAALFVGPFALEAPPYGSIYLETDGLLMGETTLAAAACYAEAGLELTLREPPDHIAVELEFMHYLTSLSAQALARDDTLEATGLAERQAWFLRTHLGAWAPRFCEKLRGAARTRFYTALAECLETFVDAEVRRPSGVVDGRIG